MLDRLKRALVESFVGAIGLGYLFAQGILNFVGIFASPIGGWVSRNELRNVAPRTTLAPVSVLEYALPQLVRFFVLMVVWYVLLRWLYFKPLKTLASGPTPNPQQPA
jgi:hypothetical protein